VPRDQPEERKAIADQLVMELSRHEAVEEMLLWPAVRERADHGEQMCEIALDQERVGKRVLNELVHKARRLGAEIERAKRLAPTRPHPHVPPNPKLLRRLAPAAAVLDRARNAMIRRPA
jgi:hypothetical protein